MYIVKNKKFFTCKFFLNKYNVKKRKEIALVFFLLVILLIFRFLIELLFLNLLTFKAIHNKI